MVDSFLNAIEKVITPLILVAFLATIALAIFMIVAKSKNLLKMFDRVLDKLRKADVATIVGRLLTLTFMFWLGIVVLAMIAYLIVRVPTNAPSPANQRELVVATLMYPWPSTHVDPISVLKEGDTVVVIFESSDEHAWCFVEHDDTQGWIQSCPKVTRADDLVSVIATVPYPQLAEIDPATPESGISLPEPIITKIEGETTVTNILPSLNDMSEASGSDGQSTTSVDSMLEETPKTPDKPTPEPSSLPTATTFPTETALPTATTMPTETAAATAAATATALPTNTPLPTATALPSATPTALAPELFSVEPSVGSIRGGNFATLTGRNFVSGAAVHFGANECSQLKVVSPTTMTCLVPQHEAGSMNVMVTNSDGQVTVLASGYTYENDMTILNINEGASYIGFTLSPIENYLAEDVCEAVAQQGGNIVEIHRLTNAEWQKHTCGDVENNFLVSTGDAIYVVSTTNSTWTVEGEFIQSSITLTLQTGKNGISLPFVSTPFTAEGLCATLIAQGIEVEQIDRLHTGGWDTHICQVPINDFPIEPGRGYTVHTKSTGVISIP